MPIRTHVFVVCDIPDCKNCGPKSTCELWATALARKNGWRDIACGYGNSLYVCPQCAGSTTDDDLYKRIVKE